MPNNKEQLSPVGGGLEDSSNMENNRKDNGVEYEHYVEVARQYSEEGNQKALFEVMLHIIQTFPERVFRGGFHKKDTEDDQDS